jgi:DNA-binding transcriptional ArsR family regulator
LSTVRHGTEREESREQGGVASGSKEVFAFIRIHEYIAIVLEATAIGTQRWELYRLLSEPVRLRLLALAAEEELAIGELAELLGESQPNISRHAAPLKQAGLLTVRKQGQRALVKLSEDATRDPVVADALGSGRALCAADGSLARIADVIRARDAVAREFFARVEPKAETATGAVPAELGAYLCALGPLLGRTELAVDAGTGDGGLLEVLAPIYGRVVAVDRSEAQLALARARAGARGWTNVELVHGELDGDAVRGALGGAGADTVFAVRLLHHAPRPLDFLRQLGALCRPGGALVVLDYAHHDDESMRAQADLWLGFEPPELRSLATEAGFDEVRVAPIPGALCGRGPDAHLPWQAMVARAKGANDANGHAKRD